MPFRTPHLCRHHASIKAVSPQRHTTAAVAVIFSPSFESLSRADKRPELAGGLIEAHRLLIGDEDTGTVSDANIAGRTWEYLCANERVKRTKYLDAHYRPK